MSHIDRDLDGNHSRLIPKQSRECSDTTMDNPISFLNVKVWLKFANGLTRFIHGPLTIGHLNFQLWLATLPDPQPV